MSRTSWRPRPDSQPYALDPAPNSERPVVFHLNGYDGDSEQQAHLVLDLGPVWQSEARTAQLPPSVARRPSATIAPKAAR